MSRDLRLGIIGLGWIATNRYLPALAKASGLIVHGVMDIHEGRARDVAGKWSIPHYTQAESLDKCTWIDSVDALVICTPPQGRAALVKQALDLGKHVLTEKPFVLAGEEGQILVDAAARSGRVLAINHNFLFSRGALKMKTDLQQGKLGQLKDVCVTFSSNPQKPVPEWTEQLPLGRLFDDLPHALYLLDAFRKGSIQLRHASALKSEDGATPARAHLLYEDACGTPMSVNCQYNASLTEWFVCLTGDKATGYYDVYRDIYIRLPNDRTHAVLNTLRTSLYAISQHLLYHIPNALAFLTGRMDYGTDEVIRRFVRSINSGLSDEWISHSSTLKISALHHEAINVVKGILKE